MQQGAISGGGWARGGASEVVRRAHPASGAQWNVQVVRGKVNGRCLWNACKALSLGLLLMVLGAAMATIGYYADHLSDYTEPRENFTIFAKNETTKSFHLNNLSYAGPIVMGVGGFIVVAACVMTFEARDSAAKVVPARFKMSTTIPQASVCTAHSGYSRHGSLKTSGVQTTSASQHSHCHPGDRRALTQSFVSFSRGLVLDNQTNKMLLKVPQGSINRSPSAPDLALERAGSNEQSTSPVLNHPQPLKAATARKPKTFAACSLLNPGLLHRHALSVDETAGNYRISTESLHPSGSHGSMTMDLHCECPITLKISDKRRNPLKRQRRVDDDGSISNENSFRRSSHTCSVRGTSSHSLREATSKGGSAHQLPTLYSHCPPSRRRSSNASDCTQRARLQKRECGKSRGHLERTISSDSRLTGAIPKYHHTAQQNVHHIPKHNTDPTSQLPTEDQGQ
ncbi:unnamed protein product [Phaedon cochleariae]|uniref:Uncharacterized protein n=1 Tax=Phaedon cochleariae TaxID=80249 RepID=A0A9N9SGL8_PHACE|nr:unnamed protein product [Phaedon cochleariae]